MKIIALIPARKGSKGILNKNMQMLNGMPLVEHTIKAASMADNIDEIWLSSDDPNILAIGKNYNLNNIKRPKNISSDSASAADVVKHFLSLYPNIEDKSNTIIGYLQPTSPLRTELHIDELILKMKKEGISSSLSVVKLEKSPFKSFVIEKRSGNLKSLFNEKYSNFRRQDLPDVYIPNGAMYFFSIYDFVKRGGFPSNGSMPYVMSKEDSIDIDWESDIKKVVKVLEDRK